MPGVTAALASIPSAPIGAAEGGAEVSPLVLSSGDPLDNDSGVERLVDAGTHGRMHAHTCMQVPTTAINMLQRGSYFLTSLLPYFLTSLLTHLHTHPPTYKLTQASTTAMCCSWAQGQPPGACMR